jgi:hypothetical protein
MELYFVFFPCFILFSMNFRILNKFLEIFTENEFGKKEKWSNSVGPLSSPRPRYAGLA